MMLQGTVRIGVVVVAVAVYVMGGGNFARAQMADAGLLAGLRDNAKLRHAEEILAPFTSGEQDSAVIVILRPSAAANGLTAQSRLSVRAPAEFDTPGAPAFYNLHDRSVRRQLRATVSEEVAAAVDRLAGDGLRVTQRFFYQFGFAARVTPAVLRRLADDPGVLAVEKDRILKAHLAQGIPLMNASSSRAAYDGSGLSIAICDTGIDTSHPRLGGGGFPNTKVIGGFDTGDGDNDPRPDSVNGDAHGTACAGIAAGDIGTVGDYIGGVAQGARLYAVKISTGNTGDAWESAMIAGWEWAIDHQDDDPANPIMVINTSFGGDRFFTACDSYSSGMTTAAANAVAAGITIFASSGNDGYCNAIAWPACISYINSVGAVYDANIGQNPPPGYVGCISTDSCTGFTASCPCDSGNCYIDYTTGPDTVTTYSNSASFLTLFAPSENAYTTDIVGVGGYSSGDYSGFGGTSAACPYAAGAAAVLQSANKTMYGTFLAPSQVRQYLVDNGDNVTDGKVAVTRPRVNLGRAVNALGYPLRVTRIGRGAVASSPAGINCGTDCSQYYTPGTQVTLTATAYSGAPFLGWTGEGCSGTGACNVTMNKDRNVTANFNIYPWAMFFPAISGGGSGPVNTNAYWGADNGVCCDSSAATFYFTLAGVTQTSTLSSCAGPSSREGWATTTPGAKTFMWELLSAGCGSYMGYFPYTLQQGIYHLFELGWNGSSFTMAVSTGTTAFSLQAAISSTGSPPTEGSTDTWQRVDEIVLDIPEAEAAKPRGILKATH